MKVYPDASLVVSAFSAEIASEAARTWFAALSPATLVMSGWIETEAASALSIKVRTGVLDREDRATTLTGIRRLMTASATDIPIVADHFRTATGFIERCAKPLRGGDALHLAIAASARAVLWTLDKPMAAAGQALGLDVRLLA